MQLGEVFDGGLDVVGVVLAVQRRPELRERFLVAAARGQEDGDVERSPAVARVRFRGRALDLQRRGELRARGVPVTSGPPHETDLVSDPAVCRIVPQQFGEHRECVVVPSHHPVGLGALDDDVE
ncbi:hypothetical protein SAMN04489730_3914 [Amycolatopsis australiensis]|uniref:Uncharacterized protein n=1 Tax=Amycolatopsis australiensis TaxID=546364 RepID=A0A1K1RT17_9PSEU|nr:hypothetical protein SAMN04489730_3914 [Amycolatopsis australiensis]